MSRKVHFSAERHRGAWLLYAETDEAQEWIDENCETTGLSDGIDADEELLERLARAGFVIEGFNDDE